MKIPATVITGFLGAGKTTLIRHLLENAGGRRIALIINEFGDLGIDGEVIRGCAIEGCDDENVVELANGCICCTVAGDFLPTMEMLLGRDTPPDHIVIETSGLALPKPLVKAFTWPEIRSRVTVDGVIAVVDAPAVAEGRFAHDPDAVQAQREGDHNLDHHSPLEELFEDQLAAADMVLLNKSDLIDAAGMETVRGRVLHELPRQVKMVPTNHGRMDVQVLLGLGAAAEDDLDARPSHHDGYDDHDHDDFYSFIVDLGGGVEPDAVKSRIAQVAADHGVLRVKGFLDVTGKTRRHVVQAVGGRVDGYYDRPWAAGEARQSRLVVIGEHGLDQPAIETALRG
ncbi:MAG: cobalamin biosynthesis protein CobW [Rhodospirillaceae bacterium]